VPLPTYVTAWQLIKMMAPDELVRGWDHFPTPAATILDEMRRPRRLHSDSGILMRDLFTGQFVCPTCTYPSRNPDGCDNPACVENPTLSEAFKSELRAREAAHQAARAADEARREQRRQLRAAGFTTPF